MRKTTTLVIVITLALGIMLTSSAVLSGASVVVFAQKNQTKTNVTPAGKQATKIINQTSIPANKTTTTIQKKTEPVGRYLFLATKQSYHHQAVKQNYLP